MTPEEPDERFVEEEEDAAAEEAGHIGGNRPEYDVDESRRALEEAGEGESEGFELAEEDLIEEASHGVERRSPEAEDWPRRTTPARSTARRTTSKSPTCS
jgi:hypothetical protein